MDFVLDCSVTMSWFFEDEDTPYTTAIRRSLGGGSQAYVPAIWLLEVGNVFIVSERRKRLSPEKTSRFLTLLKLLPIQIEDTPSFTLLGDILKLTRDYRLSAYDAVYLELALRKGIPMVSLDHDLRKAAQKAGVVLPTTKDFP